MVLDFSSYPVGDQVVSFPDYVFGSLPLEPDQIRETFVIRGTSTGTTSQAGGTADQSE